MSPRELGAPRPVFWIGTLCLLVSAMASGLLVLEHLDQLRLPGCGEGGDCEKAAASRWGSLPLGPISWPTSHLGFAYFAAALLAWWAARGALPRLGRWVARGAVLASLGFLLIILLEGTYCLYCIVAHVGNLAFGVALACTGPRGRR
ncbi:MAG: hypothetical protein GF330_13145, partial [Candidatus Eisenbacteria bacterium]|nr:hypothetical protein [Candidatus Eisenbacteria bacterium]